MPRALLCAILFLAVLAGSCVQTKTAPPADAPAEPPRPVAPVDPELAETLRTYSRSDNPLEEYPALHVLAMFGFVTLLSILQGIASMGR
jgi:hypothetical protein